MVAEPRAPDVRAQRDRTAEMARRTPTGGVVGHEAELDRGAATGAKHGGGPRRRAVTDKVDTPGSQFAGQVIERLGGETAPQVGTHD